MNEIVQFKSDNGTEVQITPQDVKNVICPGATDKEVVMFLGLCQAQRLNPFVKDAYLVKYGNSPATIITGKEVFTKRAAQHKDYEGFEAGVVFLRKGQVCQREGSAIYKAAGEQLVGGWCRVYIKGRRPFYDEVTLDEYSTGKSGWAKMPATMIRKVAIVHALREAFPESFQGLYAAEEMGNAGTSVAEAEAQPQQPQPQKPQPQEVMPVVEFVELASDDQSERIARLAVDLADMRGVSVDVVSGALFKSKAMQDAGARVGEDLTAQQADAAITLLSSWIDKAAEAAQQAVIVQEFEDGSMSQEDIAF